MCSTFFAFVKKFFFLKFFRSDTEYKQRLLEDYKQKKEKKVQLSIDEKPYFYNTRSLFPSPIQILILRRLIFSVFNDKSKGMQSMFGKDLQKAEKKRFAEIYEILGNIKYVANFNKYLNDCSNISWLWFREFYLNISDCVQFPIAMSLPWILIQFAIKTPSLAPNIFYPLCIYNDAGLKTHTQIKLRKNGNKILDKIQKSVNFYVCLS